MSFQMIVIVVGANKNYLYLLTETNSKQQPGKTLHFFWCKMDIEIFPGTLPALFNIETSAQLINLCVDT